MYYVLVYSTIDTVLGAFDVIGEGSLTDAGHKRGATVVAASPSVKALSLSRQTFDDLVSRGTIDSSVQRELHRRINHWKTEDVERSGP